MSWMHRLWNLFGRDDVNRDIDEELQFHLDQRIRDNIRAGMSPDEARRDARQRFGSRSAAREQTRAADVLVTLETTLQDLGFALRSLRKHPAFTLVAVLTLALGVGANSAIFSVVNAVLLRPLPYHQPDRLVSVRYLLGGEYLFLREHAQSVQQIALYRPGLGFNLSGGGDAERLTGAQVSANVFSTLGISAALGRTFLANEEQPGESGVVVISHALWRQRFGADGSIIGRNIIVDSEPRRVVGIMPPTFTFPRAGTQLWIPYTFDLGDAVALWTGPIGGRVVARLSPGASAAQAQEELRALAPRIREANTGWVMPPQWGVNREVVLLQDGLVGDVRTRLLVILGAVGLVLLIACANVANLLLARASARQQELAVRHALGAGRSRIVRQLLTESAVLGLLGGTLGLALAFSGVQLLVSGLPADIPRMEQIGVDRWVLGFTLVVSVLTGLGFGAVPAIRASRSDVQVSLRIEDRASSGPLGRAGSLLIVGEIGIAVLLVIGAGLLIRSFAELLRVDPGFRAERTVTARITPPEGRYGDEARLRTFYAELLARVGALPGVQAVEAVSHLPLVGGTAGFAFEVEGRPYVPGTGAPITGDRRVTHGYLRAMGIPLRRGRPLAETDRQHTPRVALINETMAREQWSGEDPIGKRFKAVFVTEWTTVVGVVGDVRYDGLAKDIEPEIYRPFLQLPARDMSLVVRTSHDPTTLAVGLREAVASVNATVPVSEIRTVDQIVSGSVAGSRFTTLLLAAFASVALALAAIGIYGVLSYAVSRRTREIGVRMALGARRIDVLRMVLRHTLLLGGAGTAAGVAAAFATSHVLESLLFGVSAKDITTFAAVPILVLAVALLAAYIPASRATRVDPTIALRLE